jgi:hypothetical protein
MGLVTLIIIAVLILAGIIVVVKLLKGLFKLLFVLAIIALVVGAGYYIFNDAKNLGAGLQSGSKLFLLDLDGNIVGGATITTGSPVLVDSLAQLNDQYHQKNYAGMLGNNFKMLIFNWSLFDDLEFFNAGASNFTKEQMLAFFRADKPKQLFVGMLTNDTGMQQLMLQGIDKDFPKDDSLKSMLFLVAFSTANQTKVFTSLQTGQTKVYPETISIKLIKLMPASLIEKFVSVKGG